MDDVYWYDDWGNGCWYYYDNDDECEGPYSQGAMEACCGCQEVGVPDFVDEAWDALDDGDWEWAVEQGEDYAGIDT